MAHVMIPAREDVEAGAIHHSGTPMQSISLSGEGCEVEQVNGSSFVIKVPAPSFDAFDAITDLSPVYDSLHDLELLVAQQAEQSKELQSTLADQKDALTLLRFRLAGLESAVGQSRTDTDLITANHHAARQKQMYISLAAFLAFIFSLVAVGVALWTLRT